jgi:hypothetical protein
MATDVPGILIVDDNEDSDAAARGPVRSQNLIRLRTPGDLIKDPSGVVWGSW